MDSMKAAPLTEAGSGQLSFADVSRQDQGNTRKKQEQQACPHDPRGQPASSVFILFYRSAVYCVTFSVHKLLISSRC